MTPTTPAERNRIRHLRDLIDHYERLPSVSVAVNISDEAKALVDASQKVRS